MGALAIAWALVGSAHAYETDQLTGRDAPLRDAGPIADAMMNVLLDEAVANTNARLGCGADPARQHDVLAREIYDATATNMPVARRGPVRGLGSGRMAALLEQVPGVDRRAFDDRSDIYGELTLWHSAILKIAGPCSTIRLYGVDVGTDKVDHFTEVGWVYWRDSRRGQDPDRAIRRGTRTENGVYGLITSKAFSFGDLAANLAGYLFYADLLGDGSPIQRDAQGCVARTGAFTWADHVAPDWDEVLSPSVYTPLVQRGLDHTLDARRDEVCAEYAAWGGPAYQAELARTLASPAPYASTKAPERTDPFRLAERCAPESAEEP